MDHQSLFNGDLIKRLLVVDHDAGDMDQVAFNKFKRKRKKRKGQGL